MTVKRQERSFSLFHWQFIRFSQWFMGFFPVSLAIFQPDGSLTGAFSAVNEIVRARDANPVELNGRRGARKCVPGRELAERVGNALRVNASSLARLRETAT